MFQNITSKIQSLPPLPKTLINIENFKQKSIQDISELIKIIGKDPLICATLLKYANSPIFGFKNKVETLKKAVELLGINFTCSIAFGTVIKNSFEISFDAYKLSADEFMELSSLSTNILHQWLKSTNQELLQDLLFPVFLSNIGMFILSDVAKTYGYTNQFYNLIQKDYTNISKIEKKMFDVTSAQITALLFKQWNLSNKIINAIKYADDIDKCDKLYLEKNKILKILTNPIHPLDDKSITQALSLSDKYNFDTKNLKKAIETMQLRLLNE